MGSPESNLPPGFRFHPTDEELILHYLRKKVASIPLPVSIIAEVDIYKLNPWELPAKAAFGEKEWYFFSPRDRKYPNGARPNRAAASGYWKATGTDKTIAATLPGMVPPKVSIGVKKALVFYKGRPPKGVKTNWIMHEYRLVDNHKPIKLKDTSMRLDDWVLCRIYKKLKFTLSSTETTTTTATLIDQDQFYEDNLQPNISKSPTTTTQPQQQQQQPQQENTLISQKSLSFSNLVDAMDYSMLSSILSEQNNNHCSNNPPPSAGFNNIVNFDQQQQINNSYMIHQKSIIPQFPNYNMENNNNNMMMMRVPKRQLSNIDEDQEITLLHQPSSKKYHVSSSCSFPNGSNAQCYDNPQWNHLMKQSLFNQHLLLAPHHLRFQ